jgi:hypothetical protein
VKERYISRHTDAHQKPLMSNILKSLMFVDQERPAMSNSWTKRTEIIWKKRWILSGE